MDSEICCGKNSTLGRVSLRDTSAESEREVSGSQSASGGKLAIAADVSASSALGPEVRQRQERVVGVVKGHYLEHKTLWSFLASPSRFSFLLLCCSRRQHDVAAENRKKGGLPKSDREQQSLLCPAATRTILRLPSSRGALIRLSCCLRRS